MDQSTCKLTLVYPPDAEDHIVDLLLNSDPPLTGFTTWRAEGHGHDFGKASVRERVRGRVARGLLVLILPRARVGQLLEEIRVRTAVLGLAFWIEPVETFGRLAHVEAADMGVAQAAA